jgi:hypothetical protein
MGRLDLMQEVALLASMKTTQRILASCTVLELYSKCTGGVFTHGRTIFAVKGKEFDPMDWTWDYDEVDKLHADDNSRVSDDSSADEVDQEEVNDIVC